MIRTVPVLILTACLLSTSAYSQVCEEPFSRPSYKSRGQYCQPGERIPDAYALNTLILCEEMEVDHLISLRQAWESGICGDDLTRFANDPKNLRFTHWRTNRTKGRNTPESFARTLPSEVGQTVIRDAHTLMTQYRVLNRSNIVELKITQAALGTARFARVPISSIPAAKMRQITYRNVGQRVVVLLSGRAVGYALNTGLAIEVLMISGWAINKITSPSQTDSMITRAEDLTAIFDNEPRNR